MQQRVALARALVNLPKVLLLDEPLGALDLKLRKGLQLELKRIQRDVGITFVYVTHDQEEALTMSDRIAVMNRGRVEQVDAPEAVYERPATTFVAGFIGVSNLMPAVVEQAAGDRTRVRLDAGVEIEAAGDGLATGERCHAVVRPEKLEIGRKEDSTRDGWPSVEGTVESSVYLGHGDADRRAPRGRRPDDRSRPERGRGRTRAPSRGRRRRAPLMGARAHPSRQRIGGPAAPRRRLNMPVKLTIAIATLFAALGLAACGSDETVGGASEEEVVVAESGPVEGDAHGLQLAGLHRPGQERLGR